MDTAQAGKRIIVALDVDNVEEAISLVEQLSPFVGLFKVGFEFIYSMLVELITLDWDESSHKLQRIRHLFELLKGRVLLDVKLNDIKNTVEGASRAITKLGVSMFNVHCLGGSAMMKGAVAAVREVAESASLEERPKIFGVTLLTTLDYDALVEIGIMEELNILDPDELAGIKRDRMENFIVRHLAWLAQECGLDGVIASALEAEAIRRYCQPEFLVATPGIRPGWAATDDQKRILNPGDAIRAGSDFVIIGRPIRKPPEGIGNPADAAKRIAEEIAEALAEKES
ncbi:MAG: orotidine-5'-phosphate decarboxylase [bacterium]